MSGKEVQKPTLTEVVVNYSAGVKVNIGNYESADVHVSETEKWNVEGLSPELAEAWVADRHDLIKERVDERVVAFYVEQQDNMEAGN